MKGLSSGDDSTVFDNQVHLHDGIVNKIRLLTTRIPGLISLIKRCN
jgi:hypothetical protein